MLVGLHIWVWVWVHICRLIARLEAALETWRVLAIHAIGGRAHVPRLDGWIRLRADDFWLPP